MFDSVSLITRSFVNTVACAHAQRICVHISADFKTSIVVMDEFSHLIALLGHDDFCTFDSLFWLTNTFHDQS